MIIVPFATGRALCWNMDIRQILSENCIRDMLTEDDARFIAAVTAAVPSPEIIVGSITRDTLYDAFQLIRGVWRPR